MKICCICGASFSSVGWTCPLCHWVPRTIHGFPAFSPEIGGDIDGFRESYFGGLVASEAQSFWFVARNRLILMALRRYFSAAGSLLEVGCGTGFVLAAIEHEFSHLQLSGSDIFGAGLGHAASRVHHATLFQMDARRMPFVEEFDVVAAFDVLEHIDEDADVLNQMHKPTTRGGGILLTVPQHPWLWSSVDQHACHKRRYTRWELVAKVQAAGFEVVGATSFVALLLPLMYLSRYKKKAGASAELQMGQLTNTLLGKIMDVERVLIRVGLSFPAGGSLLLAANKR